MDDRQYWIYWQLLIPGSGRRIWEIINYFGSPCAAWEASEQDLSDVPFIGPEKANKLVKRRDTLRYDKFEQHLKGLDCNVITVVDENYPESLKNIYDPPPAIFVRGQLPPSDRLNIAVVGSRKPTAYGVVIAETFASELGKAGLVIVSGMARGIDSAAHRGTLNVNGSTIAVLGCGPDIVYPRENKELMKQILEKGAIISEFAPGTAPQPWHFPSRNRIISGLCSGVLVVEASERSGALITADFALEQGREVMAVPGNINNINSKGTNKLIRQGARLVTSAGDILEEIGLGELKFNNTMASSGLSIAEKKVLEVLSQLPLSLEQIINESQLAPEEVASTLTFLEIKGLVKVLPGKMYIAAIL